ncbi:raftlin isoform X2 [Podarcis raffonei]|uniref:raftlin isoform X2 n=1 Tax=Podarcis raffonei TaxID=65483 RepID=UPI00232954AC|nr:raftlin isoform X2 [Podarcis raffonei]
MGCGLNKLEKHDEKRPGNIYSTLKRPQVETKIDIFYEYHFLEFTTLSDAELLGSSAIRLSSLRDLPAQLQELYQQGFILAAVHPFVQPANENERTPQEQIFRAVLIKKTERSLKNDAVSEGNTLEIESCFSSDHFLDKSKMPDLIKKIQDAASRGLRFVGIIPQYASEMNSKSSSAVISTSNSSRELKGDKNPSDFAEDCVSSDHEKAGCTNGCKVPAAREENLDQCVDPNEDLRGEGQVIEHLSLSSAGENGGQLQETEIFAVYNKPKALQRSSQYYSLTIPVKITSDGQSICSLEANWLEHMTDHFRKGSTLVNAIFSLGMINDSFQGMTDGVFIFEDISVEDNKSIQGYDAIVVEQWTVLEFHWRFSKEDRHQKQAKKSLKAKLSAKERHQTGEMQELEVTENARNSETQFCTTQSGLQFPVISDQQLAAVEDGGTETLGHGDGPLYNNEGFAEKWNAGHNAEQDGGGLCLEQTGMHENCEGQIFQDHCTATDTDWSCGAEATETSFDAGCQFD